MRPQARTFVLFAWLLLFLAFLGPAYVTAQAPPKQIQLIQSEIVPEGYGRFYLLKGLKAQDNVYVLVEPIAGNLDPLAGLTPAGTDVLGLRVAFDEAVQQALTQGEDPLTVLPEFADDYFLIWDDDSGPGYSAAFRFVVPEDGDYQLLIFPNPASSNWGKFRLAVGINAPEVLSGAVDPIGDRFVEEETHIPTTRAVQAVSGTLNKGEVKQFDLRPVKAGDKIYAYVEAAIPGSPLVLKLVDYGGKTLALGYATDAEDRDLTLEYDVKEDATNYVLHLSETAPQAQRDFRLLVGLNEPSVLRGTAQSTPDQPVLQTPIRVKIGVRMDQITGVDQKAENFSVVNTLRMEWQDPQLAFDPATCDCRAQSFDLGQFEKFVNGKGAIWPEFVYFNQQGRRDIQNSLVVVFSDGRAIYYERSTVTLQAPDFDFRLYPFDLQRFFIRIRMVFPERLFVFEDLPGFSGTGEQLGEEEWVIQDQWTEVETVGTESQFSFGFTANRHLMYYVVRIFIPVLLIIIVSWFTFFLKDYGKRVDVASANLLIFVAFNFTIADALPHLGYATILDLVLVTTFVITGVVVVFNVWLKRLEVTKKESFAQTIDKFSIWLYPLLYFAAFALVSFFFVR